MSIVPLCSATALSSHSWPSLRSVAEPRAASAASAVCAHSRWCRTVVALIVVSRARPLTRRRSERSGVLSKFQGRRELPISELRVGQWVDGKVLNFHPVLGIFVDIGSERLALCRKALLAKPISEYREGQDVSGFRVAVIDRQKGHVELSMTQISKDFKKGDRLQATVDGPANCGIFFDIGLPSMAFAPAIFLDRPAYTYRPGERLEVTVVRVEERNVAVTTQGPQAVGTLLGLEKVLHGEDTGPTLALDLPFSEVSMNLGMIRDAIYLLIRSKPSKADGDPKVVAAAVVHMDWEHAEVRLGFAVVAGMRLQDIPIGEPVEEACICRATRTGIFCDIGAECDALWPRAELPLNVSEYKVGERLFGLRVAEVDLKKGVVRVSTKKNVAELACGEKVSGFVTQVTSSGVFLDIGAADLAFAPAKRLINKFGKKPQKCNYTVGDELKDLEILDLKVQPNYIKVGHVASLLEEEAEEFIEALIERDLEIM